MTRRSPARFLALIPFLCLGLHCAPRSASSSSQLADLTRADALVREGCYRCLQDAAGTYARVMDRSARGAAARALRGAFDVSLLLAMREKEIGLDADASLARARALLPRLARPGTPAYDELAIRLDAAAAVMGDLSGLDAEQRQERAADSRWHDLAAPTVQRLQHAFEESRRTDLIAGYVALALDCEQGASRRSIEPAWMLAPDASPPLLQYRVALCSQDRPTLLTRLREDDPRWAEAFFFEGKYEMGSPSRSAEPVRAAALLASAREAFPTSIAVHVLLARALEMEGEYAAALASFNHILTLKPMHVDAGLGRVRNLSYLGRAAEAIAAATALIERRRWHVGDAYYWRAWNQYQAHRLEPAWSDVQEAMRLVANTSVYSLAGSIAYAMRDLETAVMQFDTAFRMDPTNCIAASSAGLAQLDMGAWPAASDRFSKATTCYALVASNVRAELVTLEGAPLEPALKARRLAGALKRFESADELGAQSALNAAQSYVRAGDSASALTYVERAERHPATRQKALEIRRQITRVP
jgi:tetratricopeptide (TPR) repeat protein